MQKSFICNVLQCHKEYGWKQTLVHHYKTSFVLNSTEHEILNLYFNNLISPTNFVTIKTFSWHYCLVFCDNSSWLVVETRGVTECDLNVT